MKTSEQRSSLLRSPQLVWNILGRGRYDFTFDLMPVSQRRLSAAKRFNLLASGGNLIYRRTQPWSMPLHMQFELANYCNVRCPVCPTGTRRMTRRPAALSVELFERVLREVGPYLLTASLWGWGESLLHPELARMLQIVHEYPVTTLVSTNGQNLDDDRVIDALIRWPPAFLIVAIDGLTDETNAQYRVGAKLHPALEGVRRLVELKRRRGQDRPVLHMRYIAMKHNEHEIPHVAGWARAHAFDLLTIRALFPVGALVETQQEMMPSDQALRAFGYAGEQRITRSDFICLQPFWFPTLLADGTLVPCDQDYNGILPLGTLTPARSFRSVWFGRAAAVVRQTVRDRPHELSFCRSCPYADGVAPACSIQALPLPSQ